MLGGRHVVAKAAKGIRNVTQRLALFLLVSNPISQLVIQIDPRIGTLKDLLDSSKSGIVSDSGFFSKCSVLETDARTATLAFSAPALHLRNGGTLHPWDCQEMPREEGSGRLEPKGDGN